MTTRVTSTQLASAASTLRSFRDALLANAEEFGRVVTAGRDAVALFGRCWAGPLPERVDGHVSAYVESISGAAGAADAARGTVDRWASRADALSEALASTESWLERTNEDLAELDQRAAADLSVAGGAVSALIDDRRRAASRLSELSQEWADASASFADELQASITTLRDCAAAAVGTPELRESVSGKSYFTAMATFSLQQWMPLSVIDPTGGLQSVADGQLDAFTDGEYAGLQYAVVETMHEGDIRLMDGETSYSDWYDATDYTAVRYRLEMAAELAGMSLDDATLDALALEIVSVAVFTTVSESDRWKNVDDEVDADPAIHDALVEEAVSLYVHHGASEQPADVWITEIDYALPANPTETDLYLEAWIAAKHAPETDPLWAVATTAWSFFVPDLATMNPMSDDFSPFWAGVEIVGIGNPIDEAAGAMRVGARILEGFGDAADASEDFADLNRMLDGEVLTEGLPEVAAGGNVLRPGDELLEGSDDIVDEPPGGGDPGDGDRPGGEGDPDGPGGDGDVDGEGDPDSGGDPDGEDPGDGTEPDGIGDPPPNDGPGPYVDDPLDHMSDNTVMLSEQHLTGSGETVIGPYRPPGAGPSYIDVAEQNGASYFDMGDEWSNVSKVEREAANQHVLDMAISNGDTVRLSFDPAELPADGYTWWEISYLREHGYVWVDDVTLAPGG